MKSLTIVVFVVAALFATVSSETNPEFEEYKRTHVEEFSGKFEGDMAGGRSSFRNAASRFNKWTDGKVYYEMSAMSSSARTKIRAALKELQDKVGSCLKFIERTNQRNYISITSGSGCWSYVGMIGSRQQMSLRENGCLGAGTIQHEFLHALGFQHEQCRSDRDNYLTINWDNISPSMRYNFDKDNTNNQGLPYEYESVMQYGKYAFSSNGKPSMTPKDPNARIGIRKLHSRDVKMVQKLYGCSSTGGNGGGSGSGGNGGDSTCVDKNPSCSGWTLYCASHSYVKENCKKTCNLCGGEGSGSCKDEKTSCSGWKAYCTNSSYVEYMKKTCKKTCGYC